MPTKRKSWWKFRALVRQDLSGADAPAPLTGQTPSGRREMSLQATEGGRPLAGRATAPDSMGTN
nr:MAG TPA: hypothetical protein [Caudoviricetes sp.]